MLWQPTGASEARWLDSLGASRFSSLFRSHDLAPYCTLSFREDDFGIPIILLRSRTSEGPDLDQTTKRLLNPTLLLDSNGDGVREAWRVLPIRGVGE
jgi:hypothetical protein